VDLCVPTDLHRPLTEKALGAGKHVLVEKPMSLSTDDCSAMIHAANNCGKVLMVGHVLRFWPEYVEVKEMVASGAVGSVISASFGRRCAAPRWAKWMGEPSRSGGGSFDLLIHDFDYCLCLFGRPKAVRAMGAEDLRRGIDYLDANVFFETGPVVSISGGWLAGEYPFSMEFTIIGSRGTLHFHSGGRPLTLFRSAGEAEEVPLPAQDGFEAELRAFAEACRAGRASVVCPPTESAAAVEVALAALESRRKNGAMIHV
jgi:predicted dehydrogenase